MGFLDTPQTVLVSTTGSSAAAHEYSPLAFDLSQTTNAGTSHQHIEDHCPSPPPQASILCLKDLDDDTVLTCLTTVRAVRAKSQKWIPPEWFSSDQGESILVLSGCPNHLVLAWLYHARRADIDDPQQSQVYDQISAQQTSISSSSIPSQASNGPLNTSFRPPTSPFDPPQLYNREPSANSRSDSSFGTEGHPHGCPRCPDRDLKTCDGWKRHMKEHETIWQCFVCAGDGKSGKPSSYTRKVNMVKHLTKTHEALDPNAMAGKCRRSRDKKYFSCGFCVALFGSIQEQLNHIDNEHFKRHQSIQEWDLNKVVRGLLQQHEVLAFLWDTQRIAQDECSKLSWDQSIADALQLRLEMSREPPNLLASAAINQSTVNANQTVTNGGKFMPAVDHRLIQPYPRPSSKHHFLEQTTTDRMEEPIVPAQEWFHPALSKSDPSLTQPAFDPEQDRYSQISNTTRSEGIDSVLHTQTQPDSRWEETQLRDNTSASSNSSAAWNMHSRYDYGSVYNSSSTDLESWSDTSCVVTNDVTTKPFASQLAYPSSRSPRYTSNANEGLKFTSSVNRQSTPSQRYGSEAAHKPALYPSHRRPIWPTRSGSQVKLQNHYDVPPDLNFDLWEQFMLDEDHTRSQWSAKRQ